MQRVAASNAERSPHRSPLLSIVIVVFKDRDNLREILSSIAPFTCPELEVIVIDGGSEDGTIDLLKNFEPPVDDWVSEPDRGIYDAMNKGLAAAHGTFVLHLNAGDTLLAVPWDELRQAERDQVDVLCCDVLLDGDVRFVSRSSMLSRIDNT